MFKGLANLGSILKQAHQMGSQMKEINEKLKNQTATGTAGGGLVTAEVNGLGELLRISIDQSLMEKNDREFMEDLVPVAVNNANAKAREIHAKMMNELTGGMDMAGLSDALEAMDQSDKDES